MPLWERSGLQRLHHTGGVFLPQWFDALVKRIADPMGVAVGVNTLEVHMGRIWPQWCYPMRPPIPSVWAASWNPRKPTTCRVLTTKRTLVLFHHKLDMCADHLARLLLEPLFLGRPQNFNIRLMTNSVIIT